MRSDKMMDYIIPQTQHSNNELQKISSTKHQI
jgi:hypothetical protein